MSAWKKEGLPVAFGVGVRDDGALTICNGDTTAECDGLAASCFEWACSYEQAVRENLLRRKGWSLEECIRNGHVYYCGFARYGTDDIKAFAQNEKPLIDRLTNLMGYHLVIDEAVLPRTIMPGQEFPVTVTWRNAGVAKMWFACSVALALIDDEDRVIARVWLEESKPGTCSGGDRMTEQLKGRVVAVGGGKYRLAIGLFRDCKGKHPDVRPGLKTITGQNWHPLAPVSVNIRWATPAISGNQLPVVVVSGGRLNGRGRLEPLPEAAAETGSGTAGSLRAVDARDDAAIPGYASLPK